MADANIMSGTPRLPVQQRLTLEARRVIPEAFDADGRLLSPIAGAWVIPRAWSRAISPIDGSELAELPNLGADQAARAVVAAAQEFPSWAARSLDERIQSIALGVELLRERRDLLVRLLGWELGTTARSAESDFDRCSAGLGWYLEEAGSMLEGRRPVGLVSNIASWNHPFSVLLLNVLVQVLSGNAVVAKIPTQGGGISLTLAFALLRRAGLPISLIGGRGQELSEPLVVHPQIAGLAFVGGRANGAAISRRIQGTGKRYALEMDGVNAYVIASFSNWAHLADQIRDGFELGKQRGTAYTRWIVERPLVPSFIETYLKVVSTLRVGHPMLGVPVDFGPLISARKVEELRDRISDAQEHGAELLYEGDLAEDAFVDGQSRDAYLGPTLLYGLRAPSDLYRREPFGPVDALIAVSSEEELIREANVSGGALVASVATDDRKLGERLAARLDAYKVGINRMRSRGDKHETFGGTGRSWEGAYVGGHNLVHAFTQGPQWPAGNWQ